jgi:hypothetical protein
LKPIKTVFLSYDHDKFQLPPRITPESAPSIENFVEKTAIQRRFVIGVRNLKWFDEMWISWASKLGITWVSVDSPRVSS